MTGTEIILAASAGWVIAAVGFGVALGRGVRIADERTPFPPPLDDPEFVVYIASNELPPVPPSRSERAWLLADPQSWPQRTVDAEVQRLDRQFGSAA